MLAVSASIFRKIVMLSFSGTAYMDALQQVSICDSNSEKWYRSLISNNPESGHVACVVVYVSEACLVNSFSTQLWSSCTDEYAHTYDISTYWVSSDRVS